MPVLHHRREDGKLSRKVHFPAHCQTDELRQPVFSSWSCSSCASLYRRSAHPRTSEGLPGSIPSLMCRELEFPPDSRGDAEAPAFTSSGNDSLHLRAKQCSAPELLPEHLCVPGFMEGLEKNQTKARLESRACSGWAKPFSSHGICTAAGNAAAINAAGNGSGNAQPWHRIRECPAP